jgi:hypothetical protein
MMIGENHSVYLQCVGQGVYKLTVYGSSPSRRDSGSAEVLMDEDDLQALEEDMSRARRATVTIK